MADASRNVVVSARAVCVSRAGQSILEQIDLEVEKGSPYAIVGRSGSGKTTLLMALSGLRPPDSGQIAITGESLAMLPSRERAKRVGIVFQDHQLFPHLCARDNVILAPRLSRLSDREAVCERLFSELGLQDLARRRPHELSGGQRQRVAIARTLALSPKVLLFDEPSAALDAQTTRELAELLLRLATRTQIIVVSHDLAFVEQCCDRGVRLADGRITAAGSLSDILER